MEYIRRMTRIEANKTVDLLVGYNRTFDWQVALPRRRISYNNTK